MIRSSIVVVLTMVSLAGGDTTAPKSDLLGAAPPLANVVPALEAADHLVRDPRTAQPWRLPIVVPPFEEHVRQFGEESPPVPIRALAYDGRGNLHALADGGCYTRSTQGKWVVDSALSIDVSDTSDALLAFYRHTGLLHGGEIAAIQAAKPTSIARGANQVALGTPAGLFFVNGAGEVTKVESYGVGGPLATSITGVVYDSQGTLWVGTPAGLSKMLHDGRWTAIRGRDGLPVEDITALAVDDRDRLWIGTSRGLIQYRPYEAGRQWYYRAGRRYLPDDAITAVAVSPDGKTVLAATKGGLGRIDIVATTLLERAQTIERRVNERHRRMGLVAECDLDNAEYPTSHTIGDNDNDGLWTAYHVAAMALCYGATKDAAAKASAREGMQALYMLQNASGIPGLVARSVLPLEEGSKKDLDKPEDKRQWRLTPDGKMYWKSDTSSDEIDGHYLAFYTYYEHIARHEAAEKALLIQQIRKLTDHLVDNNYQLIDWDGERTRWGFWNPEALNQNPDDYLENGLNALQILSFLRVAHYVTGDEKYLTHYKKLILEHGYLSNVLLSKKVFPDENNHSDDQLGFVAWYPILQIEQDPVIRRALHQAVRRHYKIAAPERPSFYAFVYATVDPHQTDLAGAIETLKEIPTDRRRWAVRNSTRDDVVFDTMPNRFGRPVLTRVLPADERDFAKWNGDPYEPDGGGDGRHEDDGAAYLLPYWMGRYHALIAEAN